jgi:hypothetical protein
MNRTTNPEQSNNKCSPKVQTVGRTYVRVWCPQMVGHELAAEIDPGDVLTLNTPKTKANELCLSCPVKISQ